VALADDVDEDVELVLGDVDAGDGQRGADERFVLLHGGFPALRCELRARKRRVRTAVRVSRTRRTTIQLCDDVHGGVAGTIDLSSAAARGLLATLRSPRSGMRH
jgi:hypothetical protein